MSSLAIEIKDLHAWYGESHILHGINFSVKAGEVVTLLGRNGAGRTSTLRAILGLTGKRTGSIRIHEPEMQRRVFNQLGISDEEADKRFGFFLQPFKYGAPPHGGFAFGIDRLAAILAGEENIREVIAFPKTQSGSDPMTNAPTTVNPAQLAELGIRLLPPPAKS
mgnify:FL=1